MRSWVFKTVDIIVLLILGITVSLTLAGLIWKWPFAMQFFALFRFLQWSLTALYASIPILVSGYWFARHVLHYRFHESLTWSILVAWTTGTALLIGFGLILLGAGRYAAWVWSGLALAFNLGFVFWLLARQWQPVRELWQAAAPRVQHAVVGVCGQSAKIWNVLILLILSGAYLHALIPPNTFDESMYHLVLPRLWELQQHWWMHTDNYHLMFPANIEIIWGYALAVGGLHLPRLITLTFGILTIAGMRKWLQDGQFDAWTCGMSLCFFLMTPLIMVMLAINYVEWPLLLYIFLGWRTARQYFMTGDRAYAYITAIAWGISLGAKYSALPVVFLLSFEWTIQIFRRLSFRHVLIAFCAVLMGGMVFACPWFVRNAALTHDPIYPLGLTVLFQPHLASENVPQIEHLTRYVTLSGFWRWYPWLYHATIDRTADHRLHPGWLFLHISVMLFGWKRWRDQPWLTIVMLSFMFFSLSPSPRIYFPLMGLTWLFLPDYLSLFSPHKRLRGILSGLLLLFALPSCAMSGHYWFMSYNRACQDYLLGLLDDTMLLRKDGLLTPVMEWVRNESPEDSRLWLWCGYETFYFDRWVRPSPVYEFPVFLNIIKTRGPQALTTEIRNDKIEYIVVNTFNCPLPLKSVKTEKMRWVLAEDIQQQIDAWMSTELRLLLKDTQFELYQVTGLK